MIRKLIPMRTAPAILLLLLSRLAPAATVEVGSKEELRQALCGAEAGDTISLRPGEYEGGVYINELHGMPDQPIVIEGTREAVFRGGKEALHLVDCSYITLRGFTVSGFPQNGINADDGGSLETPAQNLVFEDLRIEHTGPMGNHDALKLSGVQDFTVRGCEFAGWGGSAIDMVGCHSGVIDDCHFEGLEGYGQSNAVQIKGGSSDIRVTRSFFDHAGHRGINIGGSTGLEYFRPADAIYEAKNVTVAGNRFVGSTAPIAWVSADGGHVHHNTIYMPENWIGRILQEASGERFIPCRRGIFENNIVTFDERVQTFINVGPGTQPDSFTFRGNVWIDLAGERKPSLPGSETNSIYNPEATILKPGTPEMRIEGPGLEGVGADFYQPGISPRVSNDSIDENPEVLGVE